MLRPTSLVRPVSLIAASLLVLVACTGDDDDGGAGGSVASTPDGLVVTESSRPVGETIGALATAVVGNENLSVVSRIDHASNASNAGLELRPMEVLLFGNPALGTQLMLENQQAGLDLPQKMLAFEDEVGQTRLAYNAASYLKARHALTTLDETLETIDGALGMLAGGATGATVDATGAVQSNVAAGDGILTLASTRTFDETYVALVQAIDMTDALTIAVELDHSANAATNDLTLRPTRLVVFGNPAAGTPFMQSTPTAGIDLPQKMLVYEQQDGSVMIAWNDPAFIAQRHGTVVAEAALQNIGNTLAALAADAAGTATASP